jgi:hypothetical protein
MPIILGASNVSSDFEVNFVTIKFARLVRCYNRKSIMICKVNNESSFVFGAIDCYSFEFLIRNFRA